MSLVLINKQGAEVRIPLAQAKSLFAMLKDIEVLVDVICDGVKRSDTTATTPATTTAEAAAAPATTRAAKKKAAAAKKKAAAAAAKTTGADEAATPAAAADAAGAATTGEDEQTTACVQQADNGDMRVTDLEHSLEAMQLLAEYAAWPANKRSTRVPKPLDCAISAAITPAELTMLEEAEKNGLLPQLLDLAAYLRFDTLIAVAAAYCSTRIAEIAKAAPDIMTGAEHIRAFLHIDNGWTPEEMEHLKAEMEYAKSVWKDAY